jgi:hypothetical protein
VHNRLQKFAERETGDYQVGFRPNKSSTDHIHTLRQKMEKCSEYKIELNKLFIDFRQAFDKVHRSKMTEILKLMKIYKQIDQINQDAKHTSCSFNRAWKVRKV